MFPEKNNIEAFKAKPPSKEKKTPKNFNNNKNKLIQNDVIHDSTWLYVKAILSIRIERSCLMAKLFQA